MRIDNTTIISSALIVLFIFVGCVACLAEAPALETAPLKYSDANEQPASQDEYDEYDEWMDDLEGDDSGLQIADPLEGYNRAIFAFNDFLYFKVFKPVARGYRFVFPKPVRVSVEKAFFNIGFPGRCVNDILQLKFKSAGQETCRFVLNSTVGVLGFFNPAREYSWMNPPLEDTGQTFGTWGVGNGFYIVWPIFGPSTMRDSVGLVSDYLLQPVSYVKPFYISLGVRSFEIVNETSLSIGEYEDFKESALDPYTALKDAYIQHRIKAVKE